MLLQLVLLRFFYQVLTSAIFFVFHQHFLKTQKAFAEFLLINNSLLLENNVSNIKF